MTKWEARALGSEASKSELNSDAIKSNPIKMLYLLIKVETVI